MGVYDRLAATAKRLIAKYGEPVVLRTYTDTGTEWAPTQSTSDQTVPMAFFTLDKDGKETRAVMPGTEQTTTNFTAYVSQVVGSITPKATVIRGGQVLRIMTVERIQPAAALVVYKLRLAA